MQLSLLEREVVYCRKKNISRFYHDTLFIENIPPRHQWGQTSVEVCRTVRNPYQTCTIYQHRVKLNGAKKCQHCLLRQTTSRRFNCPHCSSNNAVDHRWIYSRMIMNAVILATPTNPSNNRWLTSNPKLYNIFNGILLFSVEGLWRTFTTNASFCIHCCCSEESSYGLGSECRYRLSDTLHEAQTYRKDILSNIRICVCDLMCIMRCVRGANVKRLKMNMELLLIRRVSLVNK